MEMTIYPIICMLKPWFMSQKITTAIVNILIYKPGLYHAYYGIYDHFHEACNWQLGHIQWFLTIMPHGYGPFNMHARHIVCISRDSHWQWQYFEIWTWSVAWHVYYWMNDHFNEAGHQQLGHIHWFLTIMPHRNSYGSFNMHSRDIVCILRDSQWQWQYFEI